MFYCLDHCAFTVDSDNVLAKLSLICGYSGLVFRVAFKTFTGLFAIKKLLGDILFFLQ
jgi:hypothetical protein